MEGSLFQDDIFFDKDVEQRENNTKNPSKELKEVKSHQALVKKQETYVRNSEKYIRCK